MKIFVLGGYQLVSSLRGAGHSVRALVPQQQAQHTDDIGYDFYTAPNECRRFIHQEITASQPDLILQNDHSGPLLHTGLESVTGIVKIWYAVDTHLHFAWYPHYGILFDKVYCAQKNRIETMNTWRNNTEWLPLFCSQDVIPVPWEERTHDISFVGKIDRRLNPQREAFFRALKERGINITLVPEPGTSVYPIYRDSKVVVNHSVLNDLNFRFFEATGSGALLVTNELTHSINEILEPGTDYLLYKNDDPLDCSRQIDWVFTHETNAREMAVRAYKKIQEAHLERHRAAVVCEWCEQFRKEKESTVSEEVVHAHLAWAFNTVSRITFPKILTGFFEAESVRYARMAYEKGDISGYCAVPIAEDALNRNAYREAMSILQSVKEVPADETILLKMLKIRIVAEAATGNRLAASHLAQIANRRFSDDQECADLLKMVGGGSVK